MRRALRRRYGRSEKRQPVIRYSDADVVSLPEQRIV